MSTIIPTSAGAALPAKTAATPTSNNVGASATEVGNEPKQQASVTVTLSEYAQKRAKSMRNAFGKLREMQARQDESRKDAARQRLEDIKKRIEMLKQLVMALGPAGAKGALRQLKQLAQELGQVASVLKEPSGGGMPSGSVAQASTQGETGSVGAAARETATVDAVGEAASVAAVEVEAPEMDAEAAVLATGEEAEQGDEPEASEEQGEQRTQDALGQARHERNARQRRADAEALKKVAAQLKQLLVMVRSQVSGKPDEESKKLIDGIDKQLAEVEKAAGEMAGGGLSLSVAVGVTLSISV
ncbi:hypothetical protein BVH03_04765 [Pseudomonas sp. PA15(2017)]|uniref:hypothetical protein n=1 Tax=Pseudomonas sp. PA15(2017) TaxID=1932111 RepID=UPI00095CBF14|nr:hypothetical protein [Pseudomonas sp. PA15(2017)]OLU33738.1 hypothetical protein BVH03_04765 [Pseudomonas sp. PA15(2017)]